MHDEELHKPGRRALLTSGVVAVASAGLATALATGVAIGHEATLPEPVQRSGGKRFAGKAVLVTGGTSGIGRATVIAFADEGARVVFCGRRETLGREVEALARSRGGDVTYRRADVRKAGEVDELTAFTKRHLGRLDIAFNNAGVSVSRPFHEITLDEFENVQDTNVRGTFLCMKAQLPIMAAQGSGSIVVTSSVQSIATRAGSAAYSASKRALVGLVQVAALEYGAQGIRINALCPGTVDTELVRRQAGAENLPEAAWAIAAQQWGQANAHGIQRMATPGEMAQAALWLASDEMVYLNGAAIVVDGGMTVAL